MILYTIGHSVYETDRFISMLNTYGIRCIADVRSIPYSRRNPQFNRETLKTDLNLHDIAYHYLGGLIGGRVDENEMLFPDGTVNYDLVRASARFQQGIKRVLELASQSQSALMCSEKDPFNCHRFVLIGRALADKNVSAQHIIEPQRIQSQHDLENRLLEKYGLNSRQRGLFDPPASRKQRIQDAYVLRNRDIAYRKQ